MDVVLSSSDLIQSVILQSAPEEIVNFWNTNLLFRAQINNSYVIRQLGEKFQWSITSYQDFLDIYYTIYLTDQAQKYLHPTKCLTIALEEGNLLLADKFFWFLNYNSRYIYSFAERAIRHSISYSGPDSMKSWNWIWEQFEFIDFHELEYERASFRFADSAAFTGDINKFNQILEDGDMDEDHGVWLNIFKAAIQSGSIQMIQRIQIGLPSGARWDVKDI